MNVHRKVISWFRGYSIILLMYVECFKSIKFYGQDLSHKILLVVFTKKQEEDLASSKKDVTFMVYHLQRLPFISMRG